MTTMPTNTGSGDGRFVPKRRTPLVPSAFKKVSTCRGKACFRPNQTGNSLCTNFNEETMRRYRMSLDRDKSAEIYSRAESFSRLARQNLRSNVSEFCWEADSWRYVFGAMRHDERLRMDKRPYEFNERDRDGNDHVTKRIPDATIGLGAYEENEIRRGYRCRTPGCTKEHEEMQPSQYLSRSRIRKQVETTQCGLIVDGLWGEVDVLFPFAVYEAKKNRLSYQQARDQIEHACCFYLAMLDDLARDPEDICSYQNRERPVFHVFCFTSCGPTWEVYSACNFRGECHMRKVWEGNIHVVEKAYELLCISDQIHEYGVKTHREFVVTHLKAWLLFTNKVWDAIRNRPRSPTRGRTLAEIDERFPMKPEWQEIKRRSQENVRGRPAIVATRKRGIEPEPNTSSNKLQKRE